MHIRIRYFAALREQAGIREERYETEAPHLLALWEELSLRFGFTLNSQQVRVAVDDEYSKWEKPLAENDLIVFIPPVAGG